MGPVGNTGTVKENFDKVLKSGLNCNKGKRQRPAQLGLGGRAEVYDAEVAGLLIGAREALQYQKEGGLLKRVCLSSADVDIPGLKRTG